MPGLLLQLAIFGAGFAGFGIIQELREGVVDRQRVTPAHRSALIMGRTLTNVVTIGVAGRILLTLGRAPVRPTTALVGSLSPSSWSASCRSASPRRRTRWG